VDSSLGQIFADPAEYAVSPAIGDGWEGYRDPMPDAEVVVVGMGPGGEHVANELASDGLDVVGVEKNLLGGECPYWGCVPSKMMIRAADLLAEGRRIPGMAGTSSIEPDWAPVAARLRDDATDNWNDRAAVERFKGNGGRFVRGEGRLAGPGRVEVGGEVFVASRAVVLGTGTEPSIPPIDGLDQVDFWTNREAIETDRLPESLVVLGGGAIGAELAQVFARFGTRVSVVEALDRLVANEEPEAGETLAGVFERDDITVHTDVKVQAAAYDGDGPALRLGDGSRVGGSRLLVATGRRANLGALGVETVGVDPTGRWVPVDDNLQVEGAERLWAVGDVTGRGAFTHVSMYQAGIAIDDILGREHRPASYRALPRVTFTDPEIASVGQTERSARESGTDVRTGSVELSATTRGWIHKAGNEGFIKLVADAGRQVLVGATVMAPSAGEVIGLLALAVHAEVPIAELRSMIYAYPTFHRGIESALADLDLD
jgi:pyruvate/2-oxoglutarate dehydrogenase complex dihydrolipoamide dehydrogenase (E3) component